MGTESTPMCWAHFDPFPPTRQTARCERRPMHTGDHARGDLAEALDTIEQQKARIAKLTRHLRDSDTALFIVRDPDRLCETEIKLIDAQRDENRLALGRAGESS